MTLLDRLLQHQPPKELSFPEEEYAGRLRRVRSLMNERGLDVLLVSSTANICYLTGYQTAMPSGYAVAVVPRHGDVTLHLTTWDAPSAVLTSVITDLVVHDWHYLDKISHLARILCDRGLHRLTIGIEADKASTYAIGALDARSHQRLGKLLPEATFVDATTLILDVRLKKSPAEIEYIRKAGVWSSLGIEAAFSVVAPGKTDNEVVAAAYAAMVAAGSELMSIDPQILTGHRTGFGPHAMYKRIPLRHGDPVYVECSASYHRYSAPMMRTASVGRPSPVLQSLADASVHTVELLIENIRAGRTAHDVAMAAKKGLAPVEDKAYFHGSFSYSVGLGFPPYQSDAPMYIAEGNDRVLETGMTLHLPIYLFVPGESGVGFSETVAVTERGCEILTGGKKRELIVCSVKKR